MTGPAGAPATEPVERRRAARPDAAAAVRDRRTVGEPARPAGRRRPRGPTAAPPGRPGPPAPRTRRSRRCTATTRTPTWCCPAILREDGLFGRDAAFATELTYGTLRQPARSTRSSPTPPAGRWTRIDPPVRDALRLGRLPAAAHPGAGARGGVVHGRPGAAVGAGRDRVRQRGAARDRRAGTLDAWLAQAGPGRARPTRSATWPLAYSHPQWIVRAFAEALGGDLGETDAAADRGQRAPAGAPVRPAGRVDRGGAGRRGRRRARAPSRRTRSTCPAARPGDLRGGRATAGRTCRTRAPSWWRPPLADAAAGRPGRAAGWTCAPARAARPACSARWPRSGAPG